MFYMKVPNRYDQYQVWRLDNKGVLTTLIKGELITYREYLRLKNLAQNMPNFRDDWIEVKKSKVVWFFGARLLSIPYCDYVIRSVDFEEVWNYYNGGNHNE